MSQSVPIAGLSAGQPLDLHDATVSKNQTNALGHLKAAAYVQIFDDAIMVFFPATGLADGDLRHGETSPFLMDLHACYLSELSAGETVRIAARLLDYDAKRARLMLTMTAIADGRLAATCELLLINMHVEKRKPAPWSVAQMPLWATLASAHKDLPLLPQAGRSIGPLAHKS
jgi:acyl-CoA thioester hydrolase